MLSNLSIGTKIGASFALALTMLSTIGLISYRHATQLIYTAEESRIKLSHQERYYRQLAGREQLYQKNS
ncbi:hypothetical protein [Gloeocapsopsis dulcis]|uniref:Uncharacterized protein n=1 Tax=Gloeocapsopsis dulcis AAB1 = 1H9 TaxID=1433147 RepID=A0A6N8G0X7_9CHRO|nr:hypothetical protein [Gloeocapsopsis dulcis]MUL38235.1 hypothetical protein [Gloeocapsopsis dulcis AAB1 = 1H9]WNN90283.1 hypothetical protein P0S91_04075 [Gloeocapsopsis dulcis]